MEASKKILDQYEKAALKFEKEVIKQKEKETQKEPRPMKTKIKRSPTVKHKIDKMAF